ncbi:mas-related G-protein coupled receptor member X1-like [Macrotis lagotis]|uniref:mas-related G-protein coupled receptor member X1-like n=1 Tax=Macrotis lagotis TaxID=92651 RepID=UPI003D69AAEC
MAVSPTPGQMKYAHDNITTTSRDEILVLNVHQEFYLNNWFSMLSLLISLAGLVGNSLVLWLLGFCIPRNLFSIYMLNLAGADALFLCFQLMFNIASFFRLIKNVHMIRVVYYITHMSYTVGMSLLASISTERCLSVLFPIWYRCQRPKHTSTVVCAVVWALAGLFWIVLLILCTLRIDENICTSIPLFLFIWFLLLSSVLCVSSLTLLLRVQCTSQHQQPPKLYLLVMLNVLVFLLCGLPLGIIHFIRYYNIHDISHWLPWFLACVNSSANPFIYFFLGRQRHQRKESLRVILQRALGDGQVLGDGATDST